MPKCTKLEWATPPRFAPCAVGEPADYTGMKINAIYDNGDVVTVEVSNRMFNESNLQASGAERKSLIIYEGQKLPVFIPLTKANLERIEVKAKPTLVVRAGTPLNRNDVTVTAFYDDGSSREVRHYKMSPFGPLTKDITEIQFRFGRCRDALKIEVADEPTQIKAEEHMSASKKVVGVSIAQVPQKTRYLFGDTEADLKGGRMDLVYNDGSVGQIDMVADGKVHIDCSKVGPGEVSFQCLGRFVSFPVEILSPEVKKIDILRLPWKQEYTEGETLDLTGMILEVLYNDGSVREIQELQGEGRIVTSEHTIDGYTMLFEGTPFTIPIHVAKSAHSTTVVKLTFGRLPLKLAYIERETQVPDLDGAELGIIETGGHQRTIPITQDMVLRFDILSPGTGSLCVEYEGLTTECPLVVSARSLIDFRMIAPPSKTIYTEGEAYGMEGLVLEAVYDNGETSVVSNYAVDKAQAKKGDSQLTFTYEGRTAVCPVTVEPLKAVSLDWIQKPSKSQYYRLETEFSCEGGRLSVKRNDGSTQEVPLTPSMVCGFDPANLGETQVTVRYGMLTVTLDLFVVERILLGIRIAKEPRLTYREGENFDLEGMLVEAFYSGGSKETVQATYTPDGPLSVETKQVLIVYRDKAAVLAISVEPLTAEEKASQPGEETGAKTLEADGSRIESEGGLGGEKINIPNFYPSSFCMRFDEFEE